MPPVLGTGHNSVQEFQEDLLAHLAVLGGGQLRQGDTRLGGTGGGGSCHRDHVV